MDEGQREREIDGRRLVGESTQFQVNSGNEPSDAAEISGMNHHPRNPVHNYNHTTAYRWRKKKESTISTDYETLLTLLMSTSLFDSGLIT